MRLKTWAALAAAALTLPFISGCGNDNANDGFVRIINATTEYASLDLYTQDSSGNDDLVVSGTAAGAASAYTGVKKGSYTFDVKSSTSAGAPTPVTGTITKDDHFAIVTYLTGTTTKTQFITEEETHPASGNAKLRVFNAAPSEAASVDVYLITSDCSDLQVTDTAFASAVTGLQTTFTQVTAASAGTSYNVCVFAAGDTSTLLLDITGLKLKDQEIATLILTRTTGGVLLNGLLMNQQGSVTSYANTSVRMRLAADAASSGVVSASANGTTLGTSASSPTVGSYKLVTAGDLALAVSINGTEVAATGFSASAGTDVTLLVAGSVTTPAITLLTDDNTPSTSSSKPVKIRLVNGLNGIGGAAMLTVDGDVVADSVDFGTASSPVNVPASSAAAALDITYAGTSLWSASSQTLTSGKVYTMFLLGDASGTPKGILRADH